MKHYAIDGSEDAEGATVSLPTVTARYRMFKIGDDGLTEPERRIADLESDLDRITQLEPGTKGLHGTDAQLLQSAVSIAKAALGRIYAKK